MIRIHLRNEQRDVRLHAMGRSIREDSNSGASGVRLKIPGQVRRQAAKRRGHTRLLEEFHIERLQLSPSDVGIEGHPLEPPEIGQTTPDLSFRCRQDGKLERRMAL